MFSAGGVEEKVWRWRSSVSCWIWPVDNWDNWGRIVLSLCVIFSEPPHQITPDYEKWQWNVTLVFPLLLTQMGWLWRDGWVCGGADWMDGGVVEGWGCSTHHLYHLPVVPDGTTQNHTEDHSNNLKSDTCWDMLKQLRSFVWSSTAQYVTGITV